MKWKQGIQKLLRERGYYLAFALCLAAVVASGWLFVRSLRDEEEALAAPEAVPAAVLPTAKDPRTAGRDAVEAPVKPNRPVTTPIPETEAAAPEPAEASAPAQKPVTAACRPVEGSVVQPYSMDKLAYNSTTRDWRTHAGMDIAAPEGSQVRAVADGMVLAVFQDDLLGQTVTVEHGGGYVTHYANLAEELPVKAGDQVSAGQILGTVGKTALGEIGSEPHLHFAVYKNNVPQDPEAFLAG